MVNNFLKLVHPMHQSTSSFSHDMCFFLLDNDKNCVDIVTAVIFSARSFRKK